MLLCALNSDFVTGVTGLVYIEIRSYDCETGAEKLTHLGLNKSKNTHNDLTLVAIEHIHHQTCDKQPSKKSPWGRLYFGGGACISRPRRLYTGTDPPPGDF